jgi:hypothetical protein
MKLMVFLRKMITCAMVKVVFLVTKGDGFLPINTLKAIGVNILVIGNPRW